MAIYGAGSKWNDQELKNDFFKNSNYQIGWDISEAEDLYTLISTVKTGDIIFLKANSPGSLNIRVKGIGIVRQSLLQNLFTEETNLSSKRSNFSLPVEWIIKEEFKLTIPKQTGKLTNVRAATLYEEHLPYVQTEILNTLITKI